MSNSRHARSGGCDRARNAGARARTLVRALGRTVHSIELDAPGNTPALASELARAVAQLNPERLVMPEASEWRVQEAPVPADRLLALSL